MLAELAEQQTIGNVFLVIGFAGLGYLYPILLILGHYVVDDDLSGNLR